MASGKLGHSVYDLWFLAWDTLCRRASAASVRLERARRVVASRTSPGCRSPVTTAGVSGGIVSVSVSRESASGFGHRGTAGASVHAVEMKTCHLWLEAAVALLVIAVVLVYVDSGTGRSVVFNAWGEYSLIRAPTFTNASVH
ncbi:hypothetical protein ALC57_08584 [Trachymyrmex cornetzi]|uniref:Uncharacterized protein n=1 Tax=Trachymyrmex cornetzi TaxID=471704 RepID=A0A151J733_9HYME|nr:hypothetical protein ALC57_08584 [Trachymyrmex cornetzi]